MLAKKQFEKLALAIQQKHQYYFDSLPQEEEKFKNIHEHFYIFSGADGAKLRFQSNAILPEEIKIDLQNAFDEFTGTQDS